MSMKLHQLRDVLAVADLGSLRAASRMLGLSQSSMSKSIQTLEKEVGVPIFERRQHGVVLTPLGRLFIERARTVTSELARAKDEIKQHLGEGVGRVSACLSTVPHMALLQRVVPAFLDRYPAVELSIVEGLGLANIEARLRDGEIDMYVGVAQPQALPVGFSEEKLFANRRCVVCRVGHPLEGAKSLAQLGDARWALSGSAQADRMLRPLFERYGLPPPNRLTFGTSILSQMVFVLHCDMLAIVPEQWLEFAALNAQLQRIAIEEELPGPGVVLIKRTSLPLTPAAEYFSDLVRRACASIDETPPQRRDAKSVRG